MSLFPAPSPDLLRLLLSGTEKRKPHVENQSCAVRTLRKPSPFRNLIARTKRHDPASALSPSTLAKPLSPRCFGWSVPLSTVAGGGQLLQRRDSQTRGRSWQEIENSGTPSVLQPERCSYCCYLLLICTAADRVSFLSELCVYLIKGASATSRKILCRYHTEC